MTITSLLGPAIRQYRVRLNLTAKELAELAGVSVRVINNVESGKNCSLSLAEQLCVAVGLELQVAVRGQLRPLTTIEPSRQRARK